MANKGGGRGSEADLNELRRILLGDGAPGVEELRRRLDDPRLRSDEVSRIISEALILRGNRDRTLTGALLPSVKQGIQRSVREEPESFANAVFPIIGPAIRRSIVEAIGNMVQTLNRTMETSLSWQGIKWRMEAARTKRPLAEIVMLHSLVFRVEEAFLIHRESGLLLLHASADPDRGEDADLVSGMLTAVQDFARDSFRVEDDQELETLQLGDLTVWITPGPKAVLACVIRGDAPRRLKTLFAEVVEDIHLHHLADLGDFQGETEPFEASRHRLEDCLEASYGGGRKGLSPQVIILALVLLAGLGVLAWFQVSAHLRWTGYLDRLAAEPGIVVTGSDRGWLTDRLSGLRDPLAADPAALANLAGIDPDRLDAMWKPFMSFEPDFVLQRAKRILDPPSTVALRFQLGRLIMVGRADRAWADRALAAIPALPGVDRVDISGLEVEADPSPVAVESAGTTAQPVPPAVDGDPIESFGLAHVSGLDRAPQAVSDPIRVYLAELHRQPGLAVASARISDGKLYLTGLRDPLAVHPDSLLTASGLDRKNVSADWRPYISLDPGIIIRRAVEKLEPPVTVHLSLDDGRLTATGTAPMNWIESARQRAVNLPGIRDWRDESLTGIDAPALASLVHQVEAMSFQFQLGSIEMIAGQTGKLTELTEGVQALVALSLRLKQPLKICIEGHTDPTGSAELNLDLSRRRAESIQAYLVSQGVDAAFLDIRALATSQPAKKAPGGENGARLRRVTFRVAKPRTDG